MEDRIADTREQGQNDDLPIGGGKSHCRHRQGHQQGAADEEQAGAIAVDEDPNGVCSSTAVADITAMTRPSSAKETSKACCQAMNSGGRQSWWKRDRKWPGPSSKLTRVSRLMVNNRSIAACCYKKRHLVEREDCRRPIRGAAALSKSRSRVVASRRQDTLFRWANRV